MAQRCSAAATLHFFHGMNWRTDVKGANYLDLCLARVQAQEAGRSSEVAHQQQVRLTSRCTY